MLNIQTIRPQLGSMTQIAGSEALEAIRDDAALQPSQPSALSSD